MTNTIMNIIKGLYVYLHHGQGFLNSSQFSTQADWPLYLATYISNSEMYVKAHTTDFKTLNIEPNFQFNHFEIPYYNVL